MDHAPPTGPPPVPARKSLSGLKFKKKSAASSNALSAPAAPAPKSASTYPAPSYPAPTRRPPKRPVSPNAPSSREPQAPTPTPAPQPLKRLPLDFEPKIAVKWRHGAALVCINTEYGPGDPGLLDPESVHACDDGLWSRHEISRQPQPLEPSVIYLAFTRVPSSESESMLSTAFGVPRQEDTVSGTTVNGRERPNIFYLRGESGAPRQDEKPTVNPRNLYPRVDVQAPSKTFEDTVDLTKEMEVEIKTLESDMYFALEMFRAAFKESRGTLDKNSVQYRVACQIQPPFAALSMARRSWGMMTWQGLESWPDYMACMHAHQRGRAFVTAYIDFLIAFLPSPYSKRIREQVGRREQGPQRGVIISGEQINVYLRFLQHLGVPVYVLVSLDEYFVPGHIYREQQPPRCSVIPSVKFCECI